MLPFMGSQRVGHDLTDQQQLLTHSQKQKLDKRGSDHSTYCGYAMNSI